MIEPVMEATLVLHRPRHDDVGVLGQQGVHPRLVPHRAGQFPPVVVGVDGDVAAHILDAVQFVDHPWATSWLRAEGALIAGTLADHHEVPDDVASAYVVAAVYAFIVAETPLTY